MIQVFLESLIAQFGVPPDGLVPIHDQALLPATLQQIVDLATTESLAWVAWCKRGEEFDLYTAKLALDLSRRNGRPTLQLVKYNRSGEAEHHAHWVRVSADRWERNLH